VTIKLNKLEFLRGFAASYVFVGHVLLAKVPASHGFVRLVFSFGQEAVMMFFILSGFVIFFSTNQQADKSFGGYFLRRWKRIYPIFLLSLATTYLCNALSSGRFTSIPLGQLLGNCFMLQDFRYGKPGVFVDTFLGNSPLWSLSYEWWFYMLFFPIHTCVLPRKQLALVTCGALCGFLLYGAWPNQPSLFLVYFLLWWSGVELARVYVEGGVPSFKNQKGLLIVLVGFLMLFSLRVFAAFEHGERLRFGVHPVLELRHFSSCFLLLSAALIWARFQWRGFQFIFGIFGTLAPISYGLYVLHFPICVSSTFLKGLDSPVLETVGYACISLLLAYIAEFPFQRLVTLCVYKVLRFRTARTVAAPCPSACCRRDETVAL
jgi:peptidoglycan/LPS O-acetylase OafA/YrhL